VRRPAKVARQLALAHHLQAAIERGLVADQAALARKLGLTRARVTQLFDLLMLAADLQEQVLALEAVDGAEPMAERTLREVAHAGTWAEQRAAWSALAAHDRSSPDSSRAAPSCPAHPRRQWRQPERTLANPIATDLVP
jgi:class 3 adenylate cyclase